MERKQNKTKAIVVLCITVVVGAILWGALYSLGLFASLIAYATAYVAIVLYDKFYKVDKKVYIISGVAITLANLLASFIAIGVAVAVEAEVDLGTAFAAVFEVIGDFAYDLTKDAILCVVMTVLGLLTVRKTYEQKKLRQQKELDAMANEASETEPDGTEPKSAEETAKDAELDAVVAADTTEDETIDSADTTSDNGTTTEK